MDDREDPKFTPEVVALLDAIRDYTQALIASSDYTGDGTHEWMIQDRCRTALGVQLSAVLAAATMPAPFIGPPSPSLAYTHPPLRPADQDDSAAIEAARLVAVGRQVRIKLTTRPDGLTAVEAVDAGPQHSDRKVWIEGILMPHGTPPCNCDHPHREGAQHKVTKIWRQPRHWETCARAKFLAAKAAERGAPTKG